eukprot:TRINITY_DN57836_c0_g1_i1.p1 TRINITY_DN57836_c0_g1~~TRINITY_DN57836_c0_g1_i1.p1  ORF type:complete len:404 (-),score=99.27 TRINITY_DN57836_c0_g1_i1:42-1229(-)
MALFDNESLAMVLAFLSWLSFLIFLWAPRPQQQSPFSEARSQGQKTWTRLRTPWKKGRAFTKSAPVLARHLPPLADEVPQTALDSLQSELLSAQAEVSVVKDAAQASCKRMAELVSETEKAMEARCAASAPFRAPPAWAEQRVTKAPRDAAIFREEWERQAMELEETRLAKLEIDNLKRDLREARSTAEQLGQQLAAADKQREAAESEAQALRAELVALQAEMLTGQRQLEELRHDCLCPIRQTRMKSPVVAADGHTYERSSVSRWIAERGTSPMTNLPLPSKTLVPNILASKFVACLARSSQEAEDAEVSSDSDSESSGTGELPRGSGSQSSESEAEVLRVAAALANSAAASPPQVSDLSAAEVLRALLTHDNDNDLVEAIWHIRHSETDVSNG